MQLENTSTSWNRLLPRLGFSALAAALVLLFAPPVSAQEARYDFRVLATQKTSTAEKEMNAAADAGFVFAAVMGGQTEFGGKEVVIVMEKGSATPAGQTRSYKLLATSRTSTMQKEMQQLGDEGFDYRDQTVFESSFGGKETAVIMERMPGPASEKIQFRLLATSRTSTMQKELREAGDAGFRLVGMSVGKTALGGAEVICILRKKTK
jgi:hypothetical protein